MDEIKGMLVFYIDVGQLPPFKAEAFMERMKEQFNKDYIIERLRKQGYETVWIPLRPNCSTRVEMVPLTSGCMPMVNHTLDPDFLKEIGEEE